MPPQIRKAREYKEARLLRADGMPYKRIAAQLSVSSASVFAWTSDIPLTAEQRADNLRGPRGPLNPEGVRRRAAAWSAHCVNRRAAFQEEGRDKAREGDLLHLAGCMLYWAEGSKGRNTVEFSNSDPSMHRMFRRFLVEALGVSPSDCRVSLNVYTGNGLTIESIERHWLRLLDLPASCLRKHTLDHRPTSSSGRSRNKLPYGVCTVRINQTRLAQHIFGAIQEYAGCEAPRWLG